MRPGYSGVKRPLKCLRMGPPRLIHVPTSEAQEGIHVVDAELEAAMINHAATVPTRKARLRRALKLSVPQAVRDSKTLVKNGWKLVLKYKVATTYKSPENPDSRSGATAFEPRQTFHVSPGLCKTYFLGHHQAALKKMGLVLAQVGLIIECRDARVPLTSQNRLLEAHLLNAANNDGGRARIIAYTKCDLAFPNTVAGRESKRRLRQWHLDRHECRDVFFLTHSASEKNKAAQHDGYSELLRAIRDLAVEQDSILGLRALLVGMPNAGKSTVLNTLRQMGMNHGTKVAATGNNPGVTRKLSSPVRIMHGESSAAKKGVVLSPETDLSVLGEGVFVCDTPGVFVPWVSSSENMVKLAMVKMVKPGLVPELMLADYLLYHLNLKFHSAAPSPPLSSKPSSVLGRALGPRPSSYVPEHLPFPTNDIVRLLEAVALRTGRLLNKGRPNLHGAAAYLLAEFSRGHMGAFTLDELSEHGLARWAAEEAKGGAARQRMSLSEAKKLMKQERVTQVKLAKAEKFMRKAYG